MRHVSSRARRKRRVALDAVMVFVIILLMTQMWLLTATLESYLAGHTGVALPALVLSAAIFAICIALYILVLRLDKAPQGPPESHDAGPWRIG